MTKHATAREEAAEAYRETTGWEMSEGSAVLDAFEAGAEWALAQVREGLEALPGSNARGHGAAYEWSGYAVAERDALAVVDRLEGDTK